MNGKYITVNVDVKAHKRLKAFCKKQGRIMSRELTTAITTHIDNAEKELAGK